MNLDKINIKVISKASKEAVETDALFRKSGKSDSIVKFSSTDVRGIDGPPQANSTQSNKRTGDNDFENPYQHAAIVYDDAAKKIGG